MGIIRLLLAIAVVSAHTSKIFDYQMMRGQIAVQLFYVISGFYMSMVLNEKYIGINSSYKMFITNRFLRLYPIYWIVLLLSLATSLFALFYNNQHENMLSSYEIYLSNGGKFSLFSIGFLLLSHIFLFGQDVVMFLGINSSTGNFFFTSNFATTNPQLYKFLLLPQAWTIGIELMFYVIAPFILRRNIKVIALLIFASLGLRAILLMNGLNFDPWSYRFFPTELVFFLFGYMSYRIYLKTRSLRININVLRLSLLVIICYTIFYKYINLSIKGPVYYVLFILLLPLIFTLTKNSKIDSKVGELSYPVYISHMMIFFLVGYIKLPIIESIGTTVCLYCIVFSLFLNKYIAEPVEKYRQMRVKRNINKPVSKSFVYKKVEIIS